MGASGLKREEEFSRRRQVSAQLRWRPENQRSVRRATARSIVETRSLIVVRVGSDCLNGVWLREIRGAIACQKKRRGRGTHYERVCELPPSVAASKFHSQPLFY